MLRNAKLIARAVVPAMMLGSLPLIAGEINPWTGVYIGAHIGGAWSDVTAQDDLKDWCLAGDTACISKYVGPFKYNASGVFGGGTAGYNWQAGGFVFGLEGDLGYMGLDGSKRLFSSSGEANGGVSIVYHQDLNIDGGLYGDITGRAGVLVWPTTLIYGKAGFAFFDGEAEQASTKSWYRPSGTGTFTGWVAGGGIEQFITPNVSIKAEYLHFDFGSERAFQEKVASTLPDGLDDNTPNGYRFGNTQNLSVDTVKVGGAYHF